MPGSSAEVTIDAIESLVRNVSALGGRERNAAYAKLVEMVHTLRMFAEMEHSGNGYLLEKLTEVQWLAEGLAGRRSIPNTPYTRILPQLGTALDSLRSPACFNVYG
jgi:hypothetical protein